jgi:1-acyl-sn-glycerol-3-phosphate acyltransferase
VFFPEGTFDDQVGLKRFHTGAFVAAARGGAPVVPAVIHGARRSMPNGALVPRPGQVVIDILAPIEMPASGGSAERLRDEARRLILAQLDEPDLAPVQSARARAESGGG